jgi:hypothetical protein
MQPPCSPPSGEAFCSGVRYSSSTIFTRSAIKRRPCRSAPDTRMRAACLKHNFEVSAHEDCSRMLADVAGRALSHCWRQSWSVNEASEPG